MNTYKIKYYFLKSKPSRESGLTGRSLFLYMETVTHKEAKNNTSFSICTKVITHCC